MTKAVNHNLFSSYTEKSCYWAGFLAADGNISETKNVVQLSIVDLDHVQKYKRDLESDHTISKDVNSFRLNFYSNQIKNDLIYNFNVTPNKCKTLEFPLLPKNMIPHFIRGYFDGDGHISIYKNGVYGRVEVGFTGNNVFIPQLYSAMNIEGSLGSIPTGARARYSSVKSIKAIKDFMYKDAVTYLSRKYDKFKDVLNVVRS